MSSRTPVDSVIDDDDELCPLCIEEFDLSDKNFKPCPCGYQICQFCYNNIKTHSEEGRCPNCRRVYEDRNIEYKVPDADEFKADLALKHRKALAARKREAEKREVEASSRKNLAGVRVVQKNLVYVIGLNPTIRDEAQLLQTLRGPTYFGQYGDIEKIVVSKAKPGGSTGPPGTVTGPGHNNQGIGVYVTFARKQDAASCIAAVDGSYNGDRVLRAQYGTTKYCSSFLRNETCSNRNCTFLHETGEEQDSFTLSQRLPHAGPGSTGSAHPSPYTHHIQPARPSPGSHHPYTHSPHAVAPHTPGSAAATPSTSSAQLVGASGGPTAVHHSAQSPFVDSSALPSTASWANKDLRTVSASGTRSGPNSPHVGTAKPLYSANQSLAGTPIQKDIPGPTPAEAASVASATAQKVIRKDREEREREKEEKRDRKAKEKEREREREKELEREREQKEKEKEKEEQEAAAAAIAAAEAAASTEKEAFSMPQKRPSSHTTREDMILKNLLKAVTSPSFRFIFSTEGISQDEKKMLENRACMIDAYGGVKRRAMRERAETEKIKAEAEVRAANAVVAAAEHNKEPGPSQLDGQDDGGITAESSSNSMPGDIAAGSSQLGGEPDDGLHPSGHTTREGSISAIQPPVQIHSHTQISQISSPIQQIGSGQNQQLPGQSAAQFAGLNINGRSLTPLQQQQLLLLRSAQSNAGNGSTGGIGAPTDQLAAAQAQQRQSNRFPFGGDAAVAAAKSAGTPTQRLATSTSQQHAPLSLNNAYLSSLSGISGVSGVQGPPPGLKTAGTPPISGGGMFAQGHGFTTGSMNSTLGIAGSASSTSVGLGRADSPIAAAAVNPELVRELMMKGRSGINHTMVGLGGVGAGAGMNDFLKREFFSSSSPAAATTAALSSNYGLGRDSLPGAILPPISLSHSHSHSQDVLSPFTRTVSQPPNQQQHQQHHNLHSQHPHAPPTHPSLAPVSGLLSSLYSAGNSGVGVGSLGLTPQAAEAYFAGLGAPAGIAAFPGLSTPTPTSTPPPAPQQSTNKQKKRGKKHRHANTSSGATAAAHASVSANLNAGAGVNPSANYTGNFNMSMNSFGLGLGSGTGNGNGNGFSAGSGGVVVGGGVVDLADPSILQARMHPSSSLSVQQQAQSHTGQSHTGQSQPRQQQQAQAHPHAQHHVQMSPNSFAGLYGGGHAAAGGYHGSSQSHPPAGAVVDEDFPPLEPPSAKLSEGIRSPIDSFRLPSHSRVSLDDVSCSRRSSTPKVPPGFTASHAQSINVALFDSPTPSHSSTAVTINNENLSQAQSPALGAATTNQAAIEPVKGIAKDANARGTNAQQFVQQTTSNGEKGLDSNKELLVQKAKEQEEKKEEVKIKGVAKQHEQLGSTKEKEWHEKLEKPRKSSEGHVKQKPIKLNLATGMPITPIEQHSPRVASPATHPLTASSIAAGSHPATPLISAKIAEVTSVQVPQKARVLRLVDTPKSEPSVSTSFSSTTTSVQGHEPAPGRPSVSSATPAEANSEYAPSLASATASRASSPPPSRIGSAPVRSMTKNQQKKERRMKAAKQVEAKTGEGTVAQQEEPEQAPIISRKRKTKKIPESSVSSKTDASAKVEKEKDRQKKKEKEQEKQEKGKESKTVKENEGSKQVAQQGMVKEPREVVNAKETVSVSATPKRSDSPGPEGEPAWASNNTFEQLFHDCEITGDSIKHCFIERLPALADIYTDMHMAGELDINAPLHNPPPLSLRTDIKCSAADFAKIRLPIRLTSEHRKMLSKGHPVRINSDSEDPKGRCLITPGGTVLRHLSAADEDRYLQLEKEIALTDDLEYWKDFPTDEITEPDISNRGGSLETIFANPERFNIQWVDDETEAMTPVPDSATDASALRAPFSGFFTAAGLSGLSQHLSDFAKGLAGLPGAQAKIDALRQAAGIPVADGALSELPGMTDQELRNFVETAQSTLEMARKEAEAQSRKFHAIARDKTNQKWAHLNVQMCIENGWHGKKVVQDHYGIC